MSGLAYQSAADEAKCTKTSKIMFGDDRQTNAPYNCTATDPNKKCRIIYEEGTPQEGEVEVLCRCSMSDSQSGFCESVIGTDYYKDAMAAKKSLYEQS